MKQKNKAYTNGRAWGVIVCCTVILLFHGHLSAQTVKERSAEDYPVLKLRSETADARKNMTTFSLNVLDEEVIKVLREIEKVHKADGPSVGPAFLKFEVDVRNKQLHVATNKDQIAPNDLLVYLQRNIDLRMKKEKDNNNKSFKNF